MANLIGTPIAIAIGGLAVVGFAVGLATVSLINIGVTCLSDVRHPG